LTITARGARLLVGSGNLSTNGIDQGREVFTAFTAGTAHGDAAIRTWRTWMQRLVVMLDDAPLAERFIDLEQRLPKPTGLAAVVDSPLWHNLDRPLADQFVDRVLVGADSVDELIVTAPFYDEAGDALGRLVERLHPARLRVYVASSTSVDGTKLAARLIGAGADLHTFAYVPDRFTHAKLICATAGDHGWLLSGSANLSRAALTLPSGSGNVELGVLVERDAETLRAVFMPPDVGADQQPITALTGLTFDPGPDDEDTTALVRIVRAELTDGGRIALTTDAVPTSTWRLADHESSQAIAISRVGATTVGSLAGPVVHLVDADMATISNYVVVEDPAALHRVLQVGDRTAAVARLNWTLPTWKLRLAKRWRTCTAML
jgi:hypothetical protein